jgi:CBS domain-containing protein
MLVGDLMSSPVVTVAPGTHLKEVADLLVRGVPGVVDLRFAEE